MRCPICGSENINIFLSRKNVPIHQNFIFSNREVAINDVKGDLIVGLCSHCEFIFNTSFDTSKIQYDDFYDNTQNHSFRFQSHINEIISYLIKEYNLSKKVVVEVGCGKGEFLKTFIQRSKGKGYGFDPSYVGETVMLDGSLLFEKKYYDDTCTDISADCVFIRHVIEHMQNPKDIMKSIKKVLVNSPNSILYIETPCVEWILKNNIMYDFFYEHCSYFNKKSLNLLLQECGFDILEINHTFKGQYLYAICKVNGENIKKSILNIVIDYAENIRIQAERWKHYLESEKSKIAIWGAGAKGVTFLNNIDPQHKFIDCVIDINENKQNKFIPGTGHEIVSFKDICMRGIDKIIVMNWNYEDEIKDLLDKHKIKVSLINGEQKYKF
ncbi:class I SAM-dependent methyltransferase [Clostridioides sp. ES-S-0001-02]|uniref:class I SAM-dependent methyltransferase n=1 Tax=Clostridioides sp. ES-S-0001-02 TaxID=2770770 RepID=UPI001D1281C4|nr:methyltransferase domain-containing protein [Clostridioides sp. ES-S-0001-02]